MIVPKRLRRQGEALTMGRRAMALLATLFCMALGARAQHVFHGEIVKGSDSTAVANAYVLLIRDGKVCKTAASDEEGAFSIADVPSGDYAVEVTCLGYQPAYESLSLTADTRRVYRLEEAARELGEVTVVADRSQTVKRTANGEVFYLSAGAKKMSNPFRALQEIPALISDPNTSTVKTLDGKAPLILINGNMVNSGIGPISPSDIESVEVVSAVSARYLQEGVTSIVNIKLKRHARPYLWLEGATRHEVPLDNGFGVGYFEVGNHKVSLYGRAAYHYKWHDDTETFTDRRNTGYTQTYDQSARSNADRWIGELLLKLQLSPHDYFAAQLYDSYNSTRGSAGAQGEYVAAEAQSYSFTSADKNRSNILTASLYYKHAFSESSELELRLAYNFNKNKYSDRRTDFYDGLPTDAATRYDNTRHSGSLNIDYAKEYSGGASLIAGSRSSLIVDDILNYGNPRFKHRNFNQYVYVGYGGSLGQLRYSASAGLEGIWAKAGDADYSYFRPRGNVSLTWVADRHNSLRLAYQLTNTAPSVAYLNPYNTSTDSLFVSVGNPNLRPEMAHTVSATYTLNVGQLYLTPEVSYKYVSDVIENEGYSEGAVFHSTYANTGHFGQASAGADVSYRFKWGRVYAGGGWRADHFMGQSAKNAAYASFGFNAQAKRFSFYGDLGYNSRDYTALSRTTYSRPAEASLQVNYNFTPDFYVGLCVQHLTGEFRSTTTTTDGTFRSVSENHFKDKRFRPWIILRYTFRRHAEQKHSLGKVLSSEEEGISIMK